MAGPNGKTGKKRVTFSHFAPEASEVYLCGSFNQWELAKTPMKRNADGCWKAQLMLAPGSYEYRLRVDGEWADDPAAEECVPNEFGSTNCVKVVPGGA